MRTNRFKARHLRRLGTGDGSALFKFTATIITRRNTNPKLGRVDNKALWEKVSPSIA